MSLLPTNMDRELKTRLVSNWLANVINVLTEQYRRPNYTELLKKVHTIDEQLPEIKRLLIHLSNTGEK